MSSHRIFALVMAVIWLCFALNQGGQGPGYWADLVMVQVWTAASVVIAFIEQRKAA